MILHKIFTEWLRKVGCVYLSGDIPEEIYELLEGGFLDDDDDDDDDDIYFKELDAVTSTEETDDKKKVFKCTMCGKKKCVSSRGLKRHRTLKHVQEEVIPKEQKQCLSP